MADTDWPLLLEPRLVFDSAFLGYGERPGDPVPVPIYDYDKVIDALIWWHECSRDEALEYVDFNVAGAWVGPGTPLLLHRCTVRTFEEELT